MTDGCCAVVLRFQIAIWAVILGGHFVMMYLVRGRELLRCSIELWQAVRESRTCIATLKRALYTRLLRRKKRKLERIYE